MAWDATTGAVVVEVDVVVVVAEAVVVTALSSFFEHADNASTTLIAPIVMAEVAIDLFNINFFNLNNFDPTPQSKGSAFSIETQNGNSSDCNVVIRRQFSKYLKIEM
ncbi:MAG: hypothetical protein GXP20_11270 [Gammaproteobacteria bacterium]|nr:hypothetical protein [Gammaproteobacteria bacterium]